jgi:hypothetical protein
MKGKITIVLFSLVLAFGMLAASCDNGDLPKRDDKDYLTLVAYTNAGNDLPVTNIDSKPTRISGKALWNKLYGPTSVANPANRTEYPADSGKYVQTYVLDTVKTKAGYNADQIAIATKYAGLPIVVRNPVLLP